MCFIYPVFEPSTPRSTSSSSSSSGGAVARRRRQPSAKPPAKPPARPGPTRCPLPYSPPFSRGSQKEMAECPEPRPAEARSAVRPRSRGAAEAEPTFFPSPLFRGSKTAAYIRARRCRGEKRNAFRGRALWALACLPRALASLLQHMPSVSYTGRASPPRPALPGPSLSQESNTSGLRALEGSWSPPPRRGVPRPQGGSAERRECAQQGRIRAVGSKGK